MGDVEKKCSGMEDEIILFIDGELSEAEKRGIESHLASCPACSKLYESYAKLDKTVSGIFVSARPLPEVRFEPSFIQRIMENLRKFVSSQRFAFSAAALAALLFSAFLLYSGSADKKHFPSAVLGRFVCPAFQAWVEPAPPADHFSAGEITDGMTVKAGGPGTFSSEKFSVIFKTGSCAKLGSAGIKLAAGEIDIDYFKKQAPLNFEITTPNSRIFIRGTKLKVRYNGSITDISVSEGVVAVMKKEGELILGAGDGAIVKKEGEPERLINKDVHLELKTNEAELKKNNDHKVPDAISRIVEKHEGIETAETIVKQVYEDTQPVIIKNGPGEKILDYEVDINSMDEKTRRLFFNNKPK